MAAPAALLRFADWALTACSARATGTRQDRTGHAELKIARDNHHDTVQHSTAQQGRVEMRVGLQPPPSLPPSPRACTHSLTHSVTGSLAPSFTQSHSALTAVLHPGGQGCVHWADEICAPPKPYSRGIEVAAANHSRGGAPTTRRRQRRAKRPGSGRALTLRHGQRLEGEGEGEGGGGGGDLYPWPRESNAASGRTRALVPPRRPDRRGKKLQPCQALPRPASPGGMGGEGMRDA